MSGDIEGRSTRKVLLALEALLAGMTIEIAEDRYRFDDMRHLCVVAKNRFGDEVLLKTCHTLRGFIGMCQELMTDEQFWGLVGDVGLNKIQEKKP